jgi:diguanylate cyclase (GGDEF)-like protein/PAS domain S-box-containing protein
MKTTLEKCSAALPLPIAIGLVLGTLSVMLWQSLVVNEHAQLQREISGQTEVLKTKLEKIVEQRILAIDRMAKRWETRRRIPRKEWQVDAHNFIAHQPGYQAIEWVDRSFHARWIVPSKGNQAAQDLDLAFEERRRIALEAARDRREITVTRTIDLVQGGKGFLVYVPLYPDDQFDGFILGVFRVQELVDQILPQSITDGYSLVFYDGKEEIYRRANSSSASDLAWVRVTDVNLRDAKWQLRLSPTPEMLAVAQSRLPGIALCVGLLIAVLLALSVYLGQTAWVRSHNLGYAVGRLQAEVSERERAEASIAQQALKAKLIHRVTAIASDLASFEVALQRCIDIICKTVGWPVGHVYIPATDEPRRLVPTDIWHLADTRRYASFWEVTRNTTFLPGIGLPGRIWTSEEPAWIVDVTTDDNFPRAKMCSDIDIRGAFGFPVKVNGDIVAVLEFFTHDKMEPDDDLLKTARTVGEQLGRVIERKRAQERIGQRERELSDFFDNAAIGLHWVVPGGVILRANQCELDMLGYAHEEYVGHHIAEFHVDQHVIQDILERLASGETLENYPARMRCKDGSAKHVLINSNVYQEDGKFTHTRCFTRDDSDRQRAEQLREEQLATAEFGLAIGEALRRSDCIDEMLRGCCEAMVKHLDAAFGRIWTLGEGQQVLELKASAGLYTHLDGPHARVRVGKFKIGLIAQEAKAHLTNEVQLDARISDKEWAQREAMIAFAGHPLIVDGQVVGVMAMFSRRTLGDASINALAVAADSIAVAIRRNLAEQKVLDRDARMRAILDSAVDAIVTIDMRGRVDSFNSAAERMFGYQVQEVLGKNVNMLMPSPYKSEHDSYLANYLKTGQKKIIGIGREVTGLRKDGSTFPMELTISEVRQSDLRLFTGIMRDISERKEAEQELAEANCLLQRQASTDALTDLANRGRFYEVIEKEWKRHQRSKTSLSVALLDVDCFKNYNDSLGHLAGDDCLKAIGRTIKSSLHRPGDFAARYGGEEFAVLLPSTDNVGAASLCESICQAIRELAIPHPNSLAADIVTVSTGYMTVIPSGDITVRDFLQEADIALYDAKEVGRDCVVSRIDYASLLVL